MSLVRASAVSEAARMIADDLVDVLQGDEEPLNDVVALLGHPKVERRLRVTTSTWWSM
jgi:hypothetical protein